MKDPSVLPHDLRDLLDAERELDPPTGETRDRLVARLGPLLVVPPGGGGGPGPADAGTSAAAATRTIANASLRAKLLVPAIAAALGAAGGAGTHAYLTRSPAVTLERAVAPGRADARVLDVPAAAPPLPGVTPPDVTPPLTGSRHAPTASTASATPASASLRSERLLLESATAALQRGDATTALSTLRQHARLYAHGALAEEREVLWIKALRVQGDNDGAERRAKNFRRNFPSSLQQGAVDQPGQTR